MGKFLARLIFIRLGSITTKHFATINIIAILWCKTGGSWFPIFAGQFWRLFGHFWTPGLWHHFWRIVAHNLTTINNWWIIEPILETGKQGESSEQKIGYLGGFHLITGNCENSIPFKIKHNVYCTKQIFKTSNVRIDTLSFLGPKIWLIIPDDIKSACNIKEFKRSITMWKPTKCRCRLCRVYMQGVGNVHIQGAK